MKKHLLMGLAALIAATGCASGNKQTAQNNSPDANYVHLDSAPPKIGDTVGFVDGRSPSQAGGETRWFPDNRAVQVNPTGGQANFVLSPRQVLFYPDTEPFTCMLPGWVNDRCEDYVCSGGAGKSELWNQYYSAPGNQKAAALDRALLGIGPSSAQKLHASGLFQSKARSWQEFRERMNTALRKGIITEQQYSEVFEKYGYENRVNLGYAGESCRVESYNCERWGLKLVVNGCQRTVTREKVLNVFNKPMQVVIRNPQLQSFETENVVVSAGPDFDSVQISNGDKTEYRIVRKDPMGDGAYIELEGVNRIPIPLPNNALVGVQFNDQRGQNMNAVVTVDPKYIGTGDDKLMFTMQVTHCPTGRLSVGCKGFGDKTKVKEAPQYFHITEAKHSFALPNIPAGEIVWVSYSLQRQNSRWYNGAPSAVTNEQKLREYKK